MRKKITEQMINKVKNSRNGMEMLEKVYLEFFGVDLTDPEIPEKGIRPTNYRISMKLVRELLDHAVSELGDDATSINLAWMNYAPSYDRELPRNMVEIVKKQKAIPA